MSVIVVRIKNDIAIIQEKDFLENNEFRTQNILIEALGLLFDKKDFDVLLYHLEK